MANDPWAEFNPQPAPQGGQSFPGVIHGAPKQADPVEQQRIDISRQQLGISQAGEQRAQAKQQTEERKTNADSLRMYGGAVSKIDNQVKRIDELLNHPGFNSVIGPIQGRLPTWMDTAMGGSKAESAQALIDQIGSAATISELQDLRASSPTGAGVGQVSNYEDQMFRNAAARLRQTQNEEDFKKSLKEYKDELLAGKRRLRMAYINDYGHPPPEDQTGIPAAHSPAPAKPQNKQINFSDLP